MRRLALLLTLTLTVLAAANTTSYEALKIEAKQAAARGDLDGAISAYRTALSLAEARSADAYDVYANVVTPLADILRKKNLTSELEELYEQRVAAAQRLQSRGRIDLGLAQADLGFYYQNNPEASADRIHGERYVTKALETFRACSTLNDHCRRRYADTAGIQGAIYFQQTDYKRAEFLFREVIAMPEDQVQAEVLYVALHALRGILILRKEPAEAEALEKRAALIETRNAPALERLKNQGTRSRTP